MALLFMDGFDAGDFIQKGWSSGASSTTTRFGSGRSLANPGKLKFSASAQAIVGFAAVTGNTNNFNGYMFGIFTDGGATAHLLFNVDVSGILVYKGGAIIATGPLPGTFNPTLWNYYEISATIATSGGTIVVRVNGQTVLNFTGNTRNGGTSTNIDAIAQSQYFAASIYDDLYVCDGTGPAPWNTFLGDVRVLTSSPTSAGASTQFTPSAGANYSTVNELPFSASQYVQSGTVGQRDTYAIADIPATVSSVLGVQTNVISKKTDTGPMNVKPALVSGGSVYYGATTPLTSNDTTLVDVRNVNPATGLQWSVTDVNNLEAGMEVS
jgi:hypothetical protein